MGFIRILLYALLIYYALKMIGRIIFPYAFRKSLEKFEKRYGEPQDHSQNREKEGEVSIEKKPDNTSGDKGLEGEYIEYEEIDD